MEGDQKVLDLKTNNKIGEIKPRSIRLDEDTIESFRVLTESIGGSQQTAMSTLLNTYEMLKARAIYTEKQEAIDTFENFISCIRKAFISSIEETKVQRDIVHTEYDALLKSKDSIIQDLQGKIDTLAQTKENALEMTKKLDEENAQLRKDLDSLEKQLQSSEEEFRLKLSDKIKLNETLTDSCSQLKEQKDAMEVTVRLARSVEEERDRLAKDNQQMELRLIQVQEELRKQNQYFEEQEKILKKQGEMDLIQLRLELNQSHQEEIEVLKEKKQVEIDDYQKKYLMLLERITNMQEAYEEMNERKRHEAK